MHLNVIRKKSALEQHEDLGVSRRAWETLAKTLQMGLCNAPPPSRVHGRGRRISDITFSTARRKGR